MKDIVIFDIDGTLANGEHRQKYVRGKPGEKNWPAYMERLHLDTVHQHVYIMFRLLIANGTFNVYIVSGRDEPYREQTEKWLKDNGIEHYKALYMRPAKDYRSDDIIKEEIFNEHFGDKKDRVLCVFDDRPRVIRMWRKIGIPVFNCGTGEEF